MRAVVLRENGGPSNLKVEETNEPSAGPKDVTIEVAVAGVNFLDVSQRRGAQTLGLPRVLGLEGAGTVVAIGEAVTDVSMGDRVCWAMVPQAGYAERVAIPADRCVPVPADIDLETAGAAIMQGLTAQFLVESTAPVNDKDAVLILPAAGGVGSLMTQIAIARGGRVFGAASTEAKREYVASLGAEGVFDSTDLGVAVDEIKERTGGGVHVVFDGIGKDTFSTSLTALRRFGTFVLFGASSGPVPPVDPQSLNQAGSVFLTRPALGHHIAAREDLLARGRRVFELIGNGSVTVHIDRKLALADAAEAHSVLEGRMTSGKVVLDPRL